MDKKIVNNTVQQKYILTGLVVFILLNIAYLLYTSYAITGPGNGLYYLLALVGVRVLVLYPLIAFGLSFVPVLKAEKKLKFCIYYSILIATYSIQVSISLNR